LCFTAPPSLKNSSSSSPYTNPPIHQLKKPATLHFKIVRRLPPTPTKESTNPPIHSPTHPPTSSTTHQLTTPPTHSPTPSNSPPHDATPRTFTNPPPYHPTAASPHRPTTTPNPPTHQPTYTNPPTHKSQPLHQPTPTNQFARSPFDITMTFLYLRYTEASAWVQVPGGSTSHAPSTPPERVRLEGANVALGALVEGFSSSAASSAISKLQVTQEMFRGPRLPPGA
jgi:hypothetical protein